MTNLVNVNLEEMRGEDLRVIAKEYKMTGAWKAKKSEMINFLSDIKEEQIQEQQQVEEQQNVSAYENFKNNLLATVPMIAAPEDHLMLTAPQPEEEIHLTPMEIKILNAMRTNEYNDAFEWPTWCFTAIDNSGIPANQARGVLSSLIKKDLIFVQPADGDDPEMIGYTDKGKKLFETATGKENSGWGGPRLLEEIEEQPEETHEEHHHGRTKKIEVYKDGQLVITINGLIETFKWAAENNIANSGWVRHSLKNHVPTVAGRRYKDGGYLFSYAQ